MAARTKEASCPGETSIVPAIPLPYLLLLGLLAICSWYRSARGEGTRCIYRGDTAVTLATLRNCAPEPTDGNDAQGEQEKNGHVLGKCIATVWGCMAEWRGVGNGWR